MHQRLNALKVYLQCIRMCTDLDAAFQVEITQDITQKIEKTEEANDYELSLE